MSHYMLSVCEREREREKDSMKCRFSSLETHHSDLGENVNQNVHLFLQKRLQRYQHLADYSCSYLYSKFVTHNWEVVGSNLAIFTPAPGWRITFATEISLRSEIRWTMLVCTKDALSGIKTIWKQNRERYDYGGKCLWMHCVYVRIYCQWILCVCTYISSMYIVCMCVYIVCMYVYCACLSVR